jgi:hypothetical protein
MQTSEKQQQPCSYPKDLGINWLNLDHIIDVTVTSNLRLYFHFPKRLTVLSRKPLRNWKISVKALTK